MHADARSVRSENQVGFENEGQCGGNKTILYHKTIKEASAVLCSVVKHLGSNKSTQEARLGLVFPPTLRSCSSRFLRALQQNRAQSRLLYLFIKC